MQKQYIVHYDIDGWVFGPDMELIPGIDLTVKIEAKNKREARLFFDQLYYGVWEEKQKARHIRIELA